MVTGSGMEVKRDCQPELHRVPVLLLLTWRHKPRASGDRGQRLLGIAGRYGCFTITMFTISLLTMATSALLNPGAGFKCSRRPTGIPGIAVYSCLTIFRGEDRLGLLRR